MDGWSEALDASKERNPMRAPAMLLGGRSTSPLGGSRYAVPRFTEIALTFAEALLDADYVGAFALLSLEAQRDLAPHVLREKPRNMYSGYAPDDRPLRAELADEQPSWTDWPAKLPGDIGWAYVSILGEEFVEAVTVTVASVDGVELIREVEWGRP